MSTCDICKKMQADYRFATGFSYCRSCLSNMPKSMGDAQINIVELQAENAELKEVLSLWIDGYELQNTHKLQRFEVWSESVNLLARSEGE